ncbi:hypothetical protein [Enterococcus sp. BWR-S5]|uniref:hypothetical protein n=1 Tax=Enterococcus sp. BWR-S5 TaxID=2787714 RepID=UPI0019225C23|nr:hypothetical protein [Enterococcus sp. BWR-S5]MBL1227217.1 hypothetical protein [Enterococcus sp. BWR-S5]
MCKKCLQASAKEEISLINNKKEIRLEYNPKGILKNIFVKHNKLLELEENKLLSRESISLIHTVNLIKAKRSMAIKVCIGKYTSTKEEVNIAQFNVRERITKEEIEKYFNE